MEKTKIEWADNTFNPWQGCAKVSPGCKNCYAEGMANRFNPGHWGPEAPRKFQSDEYWKKPIAWNRKAEKEGVRYKVFCGSMCDIFERRDNDLKLSLARNRLGELIKWTQNLDWLLLTKRSEHFWHGLHDLGFIARDSHWDYEYTIPDNVWVGVSVENQEQADKRIPKLLKIPAKVRFLSIEPLLGPIDLDNIKFPISWIIVGGESGPNARPMHPNWVRSLRDQCVKAGVPFFFKQWGEYVPARQSPHPIPHSVGGKYIGETKISMRKVGKKKAGRLLDGREWNQMPEVFNGR